MSYEVKKIEVVGKDFDGYEFGVGDERDKPLEDKNGMILDFQM